MLENEYIILKDCLNRNIRLTAERIRHIQESHPELASADLLEKIAQTLQNPEIILSSASDESVELIYRYYVNTSVGDKWLCIVVKNLTTDFFIITLYYTDSIKKGTEIWKRT
jgi:hypothetical protein